jgi:uncharacterized paraquat-inducible protein A
MNLALLGLIVLLCASWWVGWRIYLHFWVDQHNPINRCEHCGQIYRSQLTYCPRCGAVVARWSNRR